MPGSESRCEPSFITSELQEIELDFLMTPSCQGIPEAPYPYLFICFLNFRGWGRLTGHRGIGGQAACSVCIVSPHWTPLRSPTACQEVLGSQSPQVAAETLSWQRSETHRTETYQVTAVGGSQKPRKPRSESVFLNLHIWAGVPVVQTKASK